MEYDTGQVYEQFCGISIWFRMDNINGHLSPT